MSPQVSKAVAQADYATELRAQILARKRSSGAAAPAPLPAAPHQQANGVLHDEPVREAQVPEESYVQAYHSPDGLSRAAPLRAPDPHLRDPHLRSYHREYVEYSPAGTWPRASPTPADAAATDLYAERNIHDGAAAAQTRMPGLPQLRRARPSDGQTSHAVAAAVARGFVPLGVLPVSMPGGRPLAGQQAHQHMEPTLAPASLQPQHQARQQRQPTYYGYEQQQGIFGPRFPGHESDAHNAAGRAMPSNGPDYSGGHERAQQVHPITGQPQLSTAPLPQQMPSHLDYDGSHDRNLNDSSYETAGPVPLPPMASPHQPYQPQMLLSTGGASVGRRGHYDPAAHAAAAALPPSGQQMLLNPGGVSVGRRGHYHPDDHAGHPPASMQQQPMVGASGALVGRRGHYDPASAARASELSLQQAGRQSGGPPLNARQQYEADLKAQIADKAARKVQPSAAAT